MQSCFEGPYGKIKWNIEIGKNSAIIKCDFKSLKHLGSLG